MRRRRLLLVVGAAILLVVAGFALLLWLTTPTPGVTLENFRRLRVGMSAKDVEALLGQPQEVSALQSIPGISRCWRRDGEVVIRLTFTIWQKLTGGEATPQGELANHVPPAFVPSPDETFLDRIRSWLPW
jgi:hypothetical protein